MPSQDLNDNYSSKKDTYTNADIFVIGVLFLIWGTIVIKLFIEAGT